MRESISTFSALLALLLATAPIARAADPSTTPGNGSPDSSGDRTAKPEEEDYSQTPYTEYGSFNEEKNEEEDTKFFQYGRFVGVSLGLGLETADGNLGTLFQGGFPTVDFKLHYWFDFNFALDMDFYLAQHYFNSNSIQFNGKYDVSIMRVGLDLKYYFDTKDLAAAISFSNPYILVGVGSYTKSTTAAAGQGGGTDNQSAVGFNGGVGLEFALKPKRVYFTTEARIHVVNWADSNTQAFQASEGLSDINGNLYTFIGSLMFTW